MVDSELGEAFIQEMRGGGRAGARLLHSTIIAFGDDDVRGADAIGTKGARLLGDYGDICEHNHMQTRGQVLNALSHFFLEITTRGPTIAALVAEGFSTENDFEEAFTAGWDNPHVLDVAKYLCVRVRQVASSTTIFDESDGLVNYLVSGRVLARLAKIDPHLAISRPGLEAAVARMLVGEEGSLDELVLYIEHSLGLVGR